VLTSETFPQLHEALEPPTYKHAQGRTQPNWQYNAIERGSALGYIRRMYSPKHAVDVATLNQYVGKLYTLVTCMNVELGGAFTPAAQALGAPSRLVKRT